MPFIKEVSTLNTLQLVNAVQTKELQVRPCMFLFMAYNLKGTSVQVLVDLGSTHNFLTMREAH